MRKTKEKMIEATGVMLVKARECLELSREESRCAINLHESAAHQRSDADSLNDGAKKLFRLGRALEAEAINLKADLDVDRLLPRE